MAKKIVKMPDGNWIAISVLNDKKTEYNVKVFTVKEFVDFYSALDRHNWLDWGQDVIAVDGNTIIARWYADDEENANKLQLLDDKADAKRGDIPFGIYRAENSRWGVKLCPMTINQDKYIDLLSETTRDIMDDIAAFIASESRYKALNLLHKRGILLYGLPGTGKTMLINHIIDKYKDTAHVIFLENDEVFFANLNDYKEILQDKLTIFVIEEISSFLQPRSGDDLPHLDAMPEILTFLDGQASWDNMLLLATTNFPERIPINLVDRPSRFDRIIRIDQPGDAIRKKYLETVLGDGIVTQEVVEKTNGLSIAHLKEICVQVRMQNKPILSVIKELEDRKAEIGRFFMQGDKGGGSGALFT
nr:ATP-binding protein [Candidatus Sigynarchaeum springense]MDO8116870.1 ATP-binding protein [Candidatus Sigynarchaeota archaeon]